jgi:hypothetical protein
VNISSDAVRGFGIKCRVIVPYTCMDDYKEMASRWPENGPRPLLSTSFPIPYHKLPVILTLHKLKF